VAPNASGSATPATARLAVSDAPISSADARAYLLFQLPSEDRLRGISWDGVSGGTLAGRVGAQAIWSAQSPDGSRYIADGVVYDRAGHSLGALPWRGKGESATWSSDGSFCKVVPMTPVTGAWLELQVAKLGEAPRTVARRFGIYSDNASFPVLACDRANDRAIVASLGQGIALGHLWVFRLSTGALIRSVDYPGAWATVSNDGTLLAVAQPLSNGVLQTAIQRTDDGSSLGKVEDFTAHGFSANGSLVVGVTASGSTVLLDWRSGRRVWTRSGLPYGGFLVEPGGEHVAIGLGFTGGSDIADVYLVSPDGSSALLPAHLRAALQY
jgi:hypothetical protein